jgi:hypothetical protein
MIYNNHVRQMKIIAMTLVASGSLLAGKAYAAVGDPWAGAATYSDWICAVWGWLATIIIPVATLVLILAGYLWMTSEGNPERIGKAKEYITGVASGVGLLLVSYFLLNNVMGISAISILRGGCIWR